MSLRGGLCYITTTKSVLHVAKCRSHITFTLQLLDPLNWLSMERPHSIILCHFAKFLTTEITHSPKNHWHLICLATPIIRFASIFSLWNHASINFFVMLRLFARLHLTTSNNVVWFEERDAIFSWIIGSVDPRYNRYQCNLMLYITR